MASPTYQELATSTYLDLTSFQGNGTLPSGSPAAGSFTFNVALVLERANDPTKLLGADWASRQKQLAALNQRYALVDLWRRQAGL